VRAVACLEPHSRRCQRSEASPYRMRDDLGWKAVAFVSGGRIVSHADRLLPSTSRLRRCLHTTPTHAQSHGSDHLSLVSSFGADNEEQKQFAKFQGRR
jgi:hypothetical protein